MKPSTSSRVLVCIDSTDNFELNGRIYGSAGGDGVVFTNMVVLLSVMERLFDELDFPQKTHVLRSFKQNEGKIMESKEENKITDAAQVEELNEQGGKATFIVHVQFRQNASWQGTIQWVNSKKTQRFRSSLELIKLISEALPETGEEEFASWKDSD
jgi:hypothetical protein